MGRCSDARERLLASAARLVHERGYSAVSVADICADAGLKKGSFYHFFPSKKDLVLATIDAYGAAAERGLVWAFEPSVPVREQIRRWFAAMFEHSRCAMASQGCLRGCPLGNLALEMADRDEAIRDRLAAIFSGWSAVIERAIRAETNASEGAVADPARVARGLVAYVEGAMLLAKTSNDPGVFRDIADGAVALLDGAERRTALAH